MPKGVNLQLFSGTSPQANLTSIQGVWWDVTLPSNIGTPVGRSGAISSGSSGYVNLDLDSATTLNVGDYGFLLLYKLNVTDHRDSLVFAGKVQVSNITSGDNMDYP